MTYKNPIPYVDAAKRYRLAVTFIYDAEVRIDAAVNGITDLILKTIADNDGKLPQNWIQEDRRED